MTNKESNSNESFMTKVADGFSWWIGSLMGKPRSKVPNIPQPSVQQVQKVDEPKVENPKSDSPKSKNEDSVLQDVETLKNLVGKMSGGVVSKVVPVIKGGVSSGSNAANAFTKRVGPSFITKVLRVFFIILFLIIIVFVATKLIKSVKEGGEGEPTPSNGNTEEITPTPVVYNPTKASIYASNELILKLEEDINVITQELSSAVLRESQLTPPTLDFNVNFN